MTDYNALFNRQGEIVNELQRIGSNFKKDPAQRKTSEYLEIRLKTLENLWGEFESNDAQLEFVENKEQRYFIESIYDKSKQYYNELKEQILALEPIEFGLGTAKGKLKLSESVTDTPTKIEELLSFQRTNFRALSRLISSIDVSKITDKWELEDELRNIQSRWQDIDRRHLEIDNILEGGDRLYQNEFSKHETMYKQTKKALYQKLCATAHIQQATPVLEIPTFTGKYTQWPTFFDLFSESIHNNSFLSKAQKMQHLKGRVKGEAERLIQHLNISSENYDVAWDILTHRYNNPQVLFTTHIETFLNQPSVSKQCSHEIKRLYDITTECIHAIHNLGVDTNTWDPLLVHLLTKKLDSETYSDYKEARKSPRDLASLEEFMSFLENKFIALEPMHKRDRDHSTAKPVSYGSNQRPPRPAPAYNRPSHHFAYSPSNIKPHFKGYQAAIISIPKCPLCNSDHELYKCSKFNNMPAEARWKSVTKLQLCKNCLFKHATETCTSSKRCKECNNDHHTLLHDARGTGSTPVTDVPSNESRSKSAITPTPKDRPLNNKPYVANHASANDEEVLLATVLLKIKAVDGNYVTFRALLDQGSQITLISENAAQLLGLPRRKFSASVSGVGMSPKQSKSLVTLECQSIYGDYNFNTEASVIPRVISDLPNTSFAKRHWPHLQHMELADPDYNVSKPIDILLDACVYSDVIMNGLVKGEHNAPIAQQTKLGWILSGNVKTFSCNVIINNLDEIAKYWEMEEIPNSEIELTKEEQFCEEHYVATTKRLADGRYEVALPMKENYLEKLGCSKAKAIAQFKQLEGKMNKNESYAKSYKQFVAEYQELGHMRAASENSDIQCFLPHHGVLKQDSTTTKLRVVFNASSKTSSGLSLNDVMECGPNLQQDLQTLLLTWRQYKYVITADIEKMFRQILVRKDHQLLQSIIWRDSPYEPLKEFVLTTVTYGTKAAPYLAIRTLRQLAKDDASTYPLAAAALENSFYMDDLLSGQNTLQATKELQRQLIEILKGAGMNLRKWSANDSELLKDLSSEQLDKPFDFKCSESRKTLGLQWIPATDSFVFINKIDFSSDCKTKRQLLSLISKIFDPLGWLSPLTIRAKILFQKTWASERGWDDEIPHEIKDEWNELQLDLQKVNQFTIPRYLGNTQLFELHGYSDASEKAYACVVYLVARDSKGERTSRIVAAKTKLAPLNKKVSLPRLELSGALLLAQLIKAIKNSLTSADFNIYAWTDSMVVLGWLHGDVTRWKQFVANRVQQITEIIPASKWNHVRSEENSADYATRGSTVTKLLNNSLWWNGPEWLLNFDGKTLENCVYEASSLETKKHSVNVALQEPSSELINEILINNSSVTRAAKIVAWVSRFTAALRHKPTENETYLTAAELNRAYQLIIKHVQANDFEDDLKSIQKTGYVELSSKIANLNPYLDENGILRVGGRLNHSIVSSTAKHPIILSNHSRFTDLIIHQAHITTLHGGPRLTLSYIRENYWILSGMRTVKRQLRQCVKCRRFSSEKHQQIMADLPRARVTPSRPFTHTGVDFTGHVDVKLSRGRGVKTYKGYVAVFVCLATKAVHLELVSDLSTPAFLAAFRRFCARRGTPRHVYSDNGTNFIGAKRALDKEYQEILRTLDTDFFTNINQMNINWSYNAPTWASAGGIWEAAVKSFKRHFKRVLGDQKLTYEELTTLIQQIEACLNSRPLFPLTENPEDSFLTPGHFLISDSLLARPQADPENISLPARWQLVQVMNKQFWKLWASDYLQQLQVRSKWVRPTKNFEIGDIVLIKEENLPPGKWALGKVVELHPGKDGYVRVVSVKTESNILKRPITKLLLLPVETTKNASTTTNPENKTKRAKGFNFKNCLTVALLLFTLLIPPSMQQNVMNMNTTAINLNDKALYFDTIYNMQYIRDEWRLVVYYNLSGYWQTIADMETYIQHLKSIVKPTSQYMSITNQLQHELSEIEHSNRLLLSPNSKRQKRGLINGIGSAANYLFGVLDDNFALQYAKDIEKINLNENHLKQLIKNQTVIIEAELNIVQRNEQVMNRQFSLMNTHFKEISTNLNELRNNVNSGLYITSAALTASIILENLKHMQSSLIDTVTDITHGRIDTHLLPIEQLQQQINFISGQLHGDLKVPVETDNIRDVYKLLKVFTKVYKKYLIIEIKIPLVTSDMYELDKIITIPRNKAGVTYLTVPTYPYLAFNLRKDVVIFLTENDLQACIHVSEERILCTLDKPSYDLDLNQNICSLTLIETKTSPCIYEQTTCNNRWIKLHRQNVWMYSYCKECSIRTFCPSGMSVSTLKDNGLLHIGQGCVLKADSFTIYGHNDFVKKVNIQPNIEAPQISILNTLLNTSATTYDLTTENHQQDYSEIANEINTIKREEASNMSIHDIHQYSISYSIAAILLIAAIVAVIIQIKKKRSHRVQLSRAAPAAPQGGTPVNIGRLGQQARSEFSGEVHRSVSMGILSDNKGAAAPPKPPRSVSVSIPCESLGEIIEMKTI